VLTEITSGDNGTASDSSNILTLFKIRFQNLFEGTAEKQENSDILSVFWMWLSRKNTDVQVFSIWTHKLVPSHFLYSWYSVFPRRKAVGACPWPLTLSALCPLPFCAKILKSHYQFTEFRYFSHNTNYAINAIDKFLNLIKCEKLCLWRKCTLNDVLHWKMSISVL